MLSVDTPKPLKDISPASAHGADQWAYLWFTLVRFPWSSLVLVPAQSHYSTLFAANQLAEVGRRYQEEPVHVVDAERIASGDLTAVLSMVAEQSGDGARTLVAVGSPLTHDAAIPATRAGDAAVLVVEVGRSSIEDARRTIECLGGDNFIGSIAVRR